MTKIHLIIFIIIFIFVGIINFSAFAQSELVLHWPFSKPEKFLITTGYNTLPTHIGNDEFALDLAQEGCVAFDKPVIAATDGFVERASVGHKPGEPRSFGNFVIINHDGKHFSRYAHLDKVFVSEKQKLYLGQEIGLIGNTGTVSGTACPEYPGTHLHFAMYEKQADGSFSAYKPEPISGYINLAVGNWYLSDNALYNPATIAGNAAPQSSLLSQITASALNFLGNTLLSAQDTLNNVSLVKKDETAPAELNNASTTKEDKTEPQKSEPEKTELPKEEKQKLDLSLAKETSSSLPLTNQTSTPTLAPTSTPALAPTSTLQTTLPTSTSALTFSCSFSSNNNPNHQILINEIAWMGTNISPDNEWLELKNPNPAQIDLTGWQILDSVGKLKINLTGEIAANNFYLLERTDDQTVPNIAADIIYKGSLNNSGAWLKLIDNNCNVVDEINSLSGWLGGNNETKQTLERTQNLLWQTSAIANGTPKSENSQIFYGGGGGGTTLNNQTETIQSPQSTSTSPEEVSSTTTPQFYPVVITEIMYNPQDADDGREWIEILNKSTSTVDLSDWKFVEGGTNHRLTAQSLPAGEVGRSVILPNEYAVIADDPTKFLADFPGFSGLLFDSSFSLNNTGETITIKNGGLKIDEVSYESSLGANGNGDSLQLINDKWQEAKPTPGKENQISETLPNFSIAFSPAAPQAGDLITFYPSSTNPILSLEWDFGDNIFSTSSTSTHSYLTAGDYNVSLTIFAQDSSSSTSTLISVASSSVQNLDTAATTSTSTEILAVNHPLISEVQVGGANPDDEFIEIYNPSTSSISLVDYSIQYLSGRATTTKNISKKNLPDIQIPPHQFFLLVSNNATPSLLSKADFTYSFALSGESTGASVFLVNSTSSLEDINDPKISDWLTYQNPSPNTSFERKALGNDSCISPQGEGEFLGNGCSNNDFEIRLTPRPQNLSSLPEPREAPEINNFQISQNYPTISLAWEARDAQGSTSTNLSSLFIKENSVSSPFLQNSLLSSYAFNISEVGRSYNFELSVKDRDGLAAATSSSINVPSLISNTSFYESGGGAYVTINDPNHYFWDIYNPFLKDYERTPSAKIIVFYLNQEPSHQALLESGAGYVMGAPADSSLLPLIYPSCAGGWPSTWNLLSINWNGYCPNGDIFGNSIDQRLLRSSALTLQTPYSPKNGDYLTLGFYNFADKNGGGIWGPVYFSLIAVDKTKYYFKPEIIVSTSTVSTSTTSDSDASSTFNLATSTVACSTIQTTITTSTISISATSSTPTTSTETTSTASSTASLTATTSTTTTLTATTSIATSSISATSSTSTYPN